MKFDISKVLGILIIGCQNFGIQDMDVDEETEVGILLKVNYIF